MVMESADEVEEVAEETRRLIRNGREGVDWVVTVTGHSAGGILPLRTVPMMELTFAKADEPEQPLRRALCLGDSLASLHDGELLASLQGSQPFREPLSEPEPKPRKGRRGRNRPSSRD
jgi:hypothetical protein